MLAEKEKKMCRMLLSGYKKKLKAYVSRNTALSAQEIVKEYEERFYRYITKRTWEMPGGDLFPT